MMSSDEELERLRAKRLEELKNRQKQQQQEDVERAQQEAEARKQAILRRILTPKARQRLTNLKMVRRDYVEQLELQLIQLSQSGRVQLPIDDDSLKQLLSKLQQGGKRNINIRRV